MTDSKVLLELAERCEAAEGDDRKLFETAWLLVHHAGYAPENEADTCRKCDCFHKMLDAKAFESAALMLVPEGWSVGIHQQDSGWVVELRRGYNTSYSTVVFSETRPGKRAATPALALCAASLRAIAQEQDNAS